MEVRDLRRSAEGVRQRGHKRTRQGDSLLNPERVCELKRRCARGAAIGRGCDAGTDFEEAWGLVESSFESAGLSLKSAAALASIDLKANEEALHQVAEKLGLEPVFFTREQLNAKGVRSPANPVVEKYTGAVGVSEPSAMLAAGADDLVLAKRKSRRATLAVARKVFA